MNTTVLVADGDEDFHRGMVALLDDKQFISGVAPDARVIAVSSCTENRYVLSMLRAGHRLMSPSRGSPATSRRRPWPWPRTRCS